MPVIPTRTTSRGVRDIDLGRLQAADLPGIGELTALRQVDALVKSGVKLADALAVRQEKRQKEDSDLRINEAFLSYQSASLQAENEFDQIKARDSEGMFSRWKKVQDGIYKNSSADLNEEERIRFDVLAGRYGLRQNARIATRESVLHNQRIDENYKASAIAASINAYKELARPELFYENINEARRLKKELLRRNGANETDIKNEDKFYFSKAVKDAVIMTSALSLPRAEVWYDKALKDGELTTRDALLVKNALDKRRNSNNDNLKLIWAQDTAKKLMRIYDGDQRAMNAKAEEIASGEDLTLLRKQNSIQIKQEEDQRAADQREIISSMKTTIEESLTANEAYSEINKIAGNEKYDAETIKFLRDYVDYLLVKRNSSKVTNPSKLDEVYTNINKTLAGTATPEEIISSASDIDVKYGPHLSISDNKAATEYLRNNGLFGKTAYNDILQSFANMKGKPVEEVRKSREDMKEFTAYLDYARPLLPPDKTVSPIELQKISAEFFRAGEREGKTHRPEEGFFITGMDEFDEETYQEATQRGEGLYWTPKLSYNENLVAQKLIAEENVRRARQLKAPIANTEKNRSLIYKQRIMLLPSAERER